ncbi:MutS2 protein [Morus notabilis]|uniref:MutS2 protein n=1 Tax=Morus notabilis TaxID=981085 RepID=W9QX42_9ROSA|nr:MutS2 protein [Morus notabilis]
MLLSPTFVNPISISISISFAPTINRRVSIGLSFKRRASFVANLSPSFSDRNKPSVHYHTLRVLEWDKLCDSVASFARTSLGRQATKAPNLSPINYFSQQFNLRLLDETNAAVEIIKHGGCSLDFTGVDVLLVQSAIRHARRTSPVEGSEAIAVVSLLKYADALQVSLKAALKEDADWYRCFMPLTEVILGFVVNRSLVKLIQQVVDEDGSVKDSASSNVKRAREQVRTLERKVYQLLDSLIRNTKNDTSLMEVCNIDGRWCIKSSAYQQTSFNGVGSIVEPLSAVSLNDELQQARASVAKAEADALSMLTSKMQKDLDDIEMLLHSIIQLDVVNARATYGLSYGGSCPSIFLPKGNDNVTASIYLSENNVSNTSLPSKREWVLYMPKAYHPLLLQQHRQNLRKAKKDSKNASAVAALEQARPVPVDCFIAEKTRVLVITGPNTGGKTICLKTIGLASLMAKSGLYVLSSESVQIPCFDSVLADIGDEQSLSQSLSTFSGHLKQISDIQSHSTSQSLVLLDEVGAGTNPLEGAALGMSLLESFAETGCLLTIATTHHGELKTLKYSNDAFENACMEFDEVNLKPTYKILWGVPGRSNAINIAERLGLPSIVVEKARELYGVASAEIDEIILDMERLKQEYQELLEESQHHLMLSRDLHEKLLVVRTKIMKHAAEQRSWKMRVISEAASRSRSILHWKVRERRESAIRPLNLQTAKADHKSNHETATSSQNTPSDESPKAYSNSPSVAEDAKQSPSGKYKPPKVGDMVYITSLRKKGTVLRVDQFKELLVQAGSMKLKLKPSDIET